MGNLGKQKVTTSREIGNIGQKKSIFPESKFPPVGQNITATSATTDLSEYRQPQSGAMIANVMVNLSNSNSSPPPSYMKGKPLQAARPQTREANITPVHQLKAPPQSSLSTAQAPTPNQTGLPDNLKAGVENLSGYSLNNVKVHYNSPKPAQLQALAYTQGTDIHVAPGQEKHLPHETWHVVQQMQGRVKPTMQMKGVEINDDRGLEAEADIMGEKALEWSQAEKTNTDAYLQEGINQNSNLTADVSSSKNGSISANDSIIQGKWFRMSTLLDEGDEREVAAINMLAEKMDFFSAFEMIIKEYPELAQEYILIRKEGNNNGDVESAAFNILWETFEEPDQAYTAQEVIGLMMENEIIAEGVVEFQQREQQEIESLIEAFGNMNISVPFRSDVDNQLEEHYIYNDKETIMVASNPQPIQDVISNKTWQGYGLNAGQITKLTNLQKNAQTALYNIAGSAAHKIKGSRTKKTMNDFRITLDAIAKEFAKLKAGAHSAILMPATYLNNSVNYKQDKSPTEGTHVKAEPLSIKSNTAGSPPHDGRLMTSIRKLAGVHSKSYVQMHLLNDLVFGPGQLWNLTPGPKQSNVDMEKKVEDPLKRAILSKGLVINFEAIVNYKNDPNTATQKDISQNPDRFRFQDITFKATQLEYDAVTPKWITAPVQDPDVKKVNGAKVNWRYGSLPPLSPKPRIFDINNKVSDLTAASIKPKAAARIIAFVKANPAWRPGSGGNLQGQLAQAVKSYDNEKTIPNISTWKATSVLWT